jgi:hypothetical protein
MTSIKHIKELFIKEMVVVVVKFIELHGAVTPATRTWSQLHLNSMHPGNLIRNIRALRVY